MIEVRERYPLPQKCINCEDLKAANGNTGAVCDECDYTLDRFYLVDEASNVILE